MKLIVFRCTECGARLTFKEGSVLYPCKNCKVWFEIKDSKLVPVFFLTPPNPELMKEADIALPFRLFKIAPPADCWQEGETRRSEIFLWIEAFDYSTTSSVPTNHPGLSISAAKQRTIHWVKSRHVPKLITCSKTRTQCLELLGPFVQVLAGGVWDKIKTESSFYIMSEQVVALPFSTKDNIELLYGTRLNIYRYEKNQGFDFSDDGTESSYHK